MRRRCNLCRTVPSSAIMYFMVSVTTVFFLFRSYVVEIYSGRDSNIAKVMVSGCERTDNLVSTPVFLSSLASVNRPFKCGALRSPWLSSALWKLVDSATRASMRSDSKTLPPMGRHATRACSHAFGIAARRITILTRYLVTHKIHPAGPSDWSFGCVANNQAHGTCSECAANYRRILQRGREISLETLL